VYTRPVFRDAFLARDGSARTLFDSTSKRRGIYWANCLGSRNEWTRRNPPLREQVPPLRPNTDDTWDWSHCARAKNNDIMVNGRFKTDFNNRVVTRPVPRFLWNTVRSARSSKATTRPRPRTARLPLKSRLPRARLSTSRSPRDRFARFSRYGGSPDRRWCVFAKRTNEQKTKPQPNSIPITIELNIVRNTTGNGVGFNFFIYEIHSRLYTTRGS